MTIRNY